MCIDNAMSELRTGEEEEKEIFKKREFLERLLGEENCLYFSKMFVTNSFIAHKLIQPSPLANVNINN